MLLVFHAMRKDKTWQQIIMSIKQEFCSYVVIRFVEVASHLLDELFVFSCSVDWFYRGLVKKNKNFMAPFMDGVQLPQRYSHFEEAVYFLPFSSQKYSVVGLRMSVFLSNNALPYNRVCDKVDASNSS